MEYDGLSVQMGLMITLLIITLVLLAGVGFMVYKIVEYRKAQSVDYSPLTNGSELVQTVHF
jgi:hypothetical protein